MASERPDPSPQFDQTAERLRGNPRWTVRQVAGAHNMLITHPRDLTNLLVELSAGKVAASAGA